jgi:hypothetical protein
MSLRPFPGRLAVLVGAAVLLLGSCTGSGDDSGDSSPSGGASASSPTPAATDDPTDGIPPPYLPVPDGVVLTDQGSELGIGESAVIAWKPKKGEVGVVSLTVRKLQRAPIKALADWQLDKTGRTSSLFYVTVGVKNVGEQDLAGVRLPLYVASGDTTLVESNAFKTEFKPCRSPAPPEPFGTGDKTTACLVYLVPDHGRLTSVTFRPSAAFNPITWVGEVEQPAKPGKKPEKGQ